MTTSGMITSWSVNRRNAAGSDSRTEVSRTKTLPAGAGSASACRSRTLRREAVARLLVTLSAGSEEEATPASVRRDVTGLLQRACNPPPAVRHLRPPAHAQGRIAGPVAQVVAGPGRP